MTGFVSIILLPIRYSMIIGLTVLALLYYNQLQLQNPDGTTDFEKVLPAAINTFLPVGILGIVLTGLLGAFMGTFSGTLNAAQAYITNDIYLKYVNPGASNRKVMRLNYFAGIAVVALGIFFGFMARNVNETLQWIVSGLYGGYVAANCLKWYWWRFNANGFFWGMMAGILGALAMPRSIEWAFNHGFITETHPLYWWPVLFLVSLIACFIGTWSSAPTELNVLKSFYRTVKPWGFWKPILAEVQKDDPDFLPNGRFKLDMFNVVLGIIAQCCLTLLPMYLVLWMKLPLLLTIGILLIIILILKRTWWDKLEN